MNKNGFTLVELLVVVAILAVASGLVATRFFNLIDDKDKYEDKVLAKKLAEAAYVYYKHGDMSATYVKEISDDNYCITAERLINSGYISEDQGLLKQYGNDLNKFAVRVYVEAGEKKTQVFKSNRETECNISSNICCDSAQGTEINYEE